MFYQAYAVANKGKANEQRELLHFTPDKDDAILAIRNAVASGFDYGYLKQGFEIVQSFNESSFTRDPSE